MPVVTVYEHNELDVANRTQRFIPVITLPQFNKISLIFDQLLVKHLSVRRALVQVKFGTKSQFSGTKSILKGKKS